MAWDGDAAPLTLSLGKMSVSGTAQSTLSVSLLSGWHRVVWIAKRFWYVRFVLNWAWEPDRYDFDERVEHLGLFEQGKLIGGVRLFYFEGLEESMQYRVPEFRTMLSEEMWERLEGVEHEVVEATRLLLFSSLRGVKRRWALKLLARAMYWRSRKKQKPLLLAIGNPFTLQMLKRTGVAEIKVIGEKRIKSKNRFERRFYGEEVPHYAILVNFLESERRSSDSWWYEGMSLPIWSEEKVHNVRRLWRELDGARSVDAELA